MHRTELLEKLRRYEPWDAPDRECHERFRAFVEAEPRCFERTLSKGHVTGSAWIVDAAAERALLTHHRKLGRWLQLGGHADGDPDILAVALREAHEESGLGGLRPVTEEILDLDIHPIPARGSEPEHFHYDVRFAVQATGACELQISEESLDLAWVDLERVSELTGEESVLRMLRKWRRRSGGG